MATAAVHARQAISFMDFAKIQFQVGTITKVAAFPKARNPSYQVTVNFGNRILTTAAQLPHNYPNMDSLVDKSIIGITNFPPKKIAGFPSQFLMVGFPDARGHVQLLNTRDRVILAGTRLYERPAARKDALDDDFKANAETQNAEETPAPISYDDFLKADIRSGTVLSVTSTEQGAVMAEVDIGPLGKRKVTLPDVEVERAEELVGTQVALLINLENGSSEDLESLVLSAPSDRARYPLGVDRVLDIPTQNGLNLF